MTRRMLFSIILSLLALALPGCGLLEDPPPTVTPPEPVGPGSGATPSSIFGNNGSCS